MTTSKYQQQYMKISCYTQPPYWQQVNTSNTMKIEFSSNHWMTMQYDPIIIGLIVSKMLTTDAA